MSANSLTVMRRNIRRASTTVVRIRFDNNFAGNYRELLPAGACATIVVRLTKAHAPKGGVAKLPVYGVT